MPQNKTMAVIDENRDGLSPEQLPGYVSPVDDRESAPKINTTVLDTTEVAGQLPQTNQKDRRLPLDLNVDLHNNIRSSQERFEELLREHESMKAAFLDIEQCIQRAQDKHKTTGDFVMPMPGLSQLSRIPLPIYQAYRRTDDPRIIYHQVQPTLCNHCRIPVLVNTMEFRQVSSLPKATQEKLPYSIYHSPGKHITFIPESLDSLLRRQSKSRLPVWMKKWRKSLARSTVAQSRIPFAKSRIPVAEAHKPATDSSIPVTTSRIPMTTSRIPVKTSRIPVTKSRIPVATSRISVATSRISVETSRISVETSRISVATSRIPVATSRISVATSRIPVAESRIPVAVSQIHDIIPETKVSPLKQAKRVILKKFSKLSHTSNFPSLDKFFKRLFTNKHV